MLPTDAPTIGLTFYVVSVAFLVAPIAVHFYCLKYRGMKFSSKAIGFGLVLGIPAYFVATIIGDFLVPIIW